MKFTRRSALLAPAALAAARILPAQAQASFPSQTVRIIVPYSPGALPTSRHA
ncbi:hypothetical protein ACFQU7_02340 [Pseudoroseomonas wenyumeiae]